MIDKQHELIIKILHQPKPSEPEDTGGKIGREAFLYLDGDKDDYAQCSSCFLFHPEKERCAILGHDFKVVAEATCGLYIPGEPDLKQPIVARLTPEEAGYLNHPVRCENCVYGGEECQLFKTLNKRLPSIFNLDTKIVPRGCCNAFTAKD